MFIDQEELTIVQLVLVNDTGDSFYRMRWPGAELTKQNPKLRVINLDAQAKERFELSDVHPVLRVSEALCNGVAN